MRRISLLVAVCCLLINACASHQGAAPRPFPSATSTEIVIAEMSATREKALAGNHLAMYVLGANWCHDSTDFAGLLERSPAAGEINGHYEVQFIDVGYLEHIQEYVSLYDVPVIYATPTILVVDPASNTLMNRDSLSYWRNASTQSPADVVDYFSRYRPVQASTAVARTAPQLAAALDSIDRFERQQAQRIYAAYAWLGPMLKAYDEGEPPAGFEEKWKNLGAMRAALPGDLAALRDAARQQAAAGHPDIELEFPHYTLFVDE